MRVAIVGGGTAGLVTAYLLTGHHELTVFEESSALGGHVRTLNGNVPMAGHETVPSLDAGVVEFDENHFPTLARLLDELKVDRNTAPGTTALFLADGRHFRSPQNIRLGASGAFERLRAKARLLPLARQKQRFEQRAGSASPRELTSCAIGDYLEPGVYATWMRTLLMYAYSIPYSETAAIPAALAAPVLLAFTNGASWTSVRQGSWEYLRRLVESTEARVVCDAGVASIARTRGGVTVRLRSGDTLAFDVVVFATPPDQVLSLLADPTPAETRRFRAWRANRIHTLIHTDTSLYTRRGAGYYSEFDLFEGRDGTAGYNAYLNRLAGLPPGHSTHYFLAYGLDHEIDPARVVHRQHHHTPFYTVDALRHRDEVREAQGEDGTFHAGAWLGNGLQEGAVTSAVAVSERLGGRRL